jgi:hypothetical protein
MIPASLYGVFSSIIKKKGPVRGQTDLVISQSPEL